MTNVQFFIGYTLKKLEVSYHLRCYLWLFNFAWLSFSKCHEYFQDKINDQWLTTIKGKDSLNCLPVFTLIQLQIKKTFVICLQLQDVRILYFT